MTQPDTKSRINSKERVKLTIDHKQTDRVPKGELLIEDEFIARALNIGNVTFENKLELVRKLDLDIMSLHPIYPKHPASNREFPSLDNVLWGDLKDWVRQSGLFTFAVLDGLLGWGVRYFGYRNFLILPKKSPIEFEHFRKRVIVYNAELAENLIDQGIDGLILADDLAYQQGLLFSPDITKEYFLSSLAIQIEKISSNGTPVFFHSDGNLTSIMQDIVSMGFHGLHCLDKNSGMDVIQLQRDYGQKMTLWGSLSVEDIIKSNQNNYREELIKRIILLNRNKGFILGTDSGLFPGIDFKSLSELYKRF